MRKVVIIEEDKNFALSLRQELERDQQYAVARILNNEQESSEWLAGGGLNGVQCVLINVLLPKGPDDRQISSICGLRLVNEIRKVHHFNGVILVLTSSSDIADGERALQAGCDSYLCKQPNDVATIIEELQLALRGDLMMISRSMRHVFLRAELSAKEARLMDLVSSGHSWSQVASELDYKTAKAAANIGYRIFDKLLTAHDKVDGHERRRDKALERWRARLGTSAAPATAEGESLSNP